MLNKGYYQIIKNSKTFLVGPGNDAKQDNHASDLSDDDDGAQISNNATAEAHYDKKSSDDIVF